MNQKKITFGNGLSLIVIKCQAPEVHHHDQLQGGNDICSEKCLGDKNMQNLITDGDSEGASQS